MRKKPNRNELARMATSDVIFKTEIAPTQVTDARGRPTQQSHAYGTRVPAMKLFFKVREDGALIALPRVDQANIGTNGYNFKFKTGLKLHNNPDWRWVKKRTPEGIQMGLMYSPRYNYTKASDKKFHLVLNELEVRLLRARRDSKRADLKAIKVIKAIKAKPNEETK